jgi:hypothetical protein
MPLVQPVILFTDPCVTGNTLSDGGGTAPVEFCLCRAFGIGTLATVQFWPTGAAAGIASARFRINGGAFTPIALAPLASGGQSGAIPMNGIPRDRNLLRVEATDTGGNVKAVEVVFYLQGQIGSAFLLGCDVPEKSARALAKTAKAKKAVKKATGRKKK